MSNVPPAVPPAGLGPATSSPNSQGGLSQQQENAGQHSAGRQAPQAPAPAPASPAVTIAASVVGLREGMRLKGTMVGADANGLPVVRTPNGTFVLSQAPEQLALNSDIELEIRVAGNKITALILSMNGKAQHPPKEISLTMTNTGAENTAGKTLAGGSPGSLSSGLSSGLAPRGGQPVTFNIGTRLTATILTATPMPASKSPLVAGGTLILKISDVSVALPSGQPSTPGATSTTGTVSPTSLATDIKAGLVANQAASGTRTGVLGGEAARASLATPPTASTTSSGTATAAGSSVPAQSTNSALIASATATAANNPASVSTPGSSPSPALSAAISQGALLSQQNTQATTPVATNIPAHGRTLSGEVIGPNKDGGLMVRTPLGDISLMTRAVLPPGSRLTFETVAARAPESTQRPLAQGQSAPLEGGAIARETMATVKNFAREWPALKEVLATLQSANPAAAQQLVASALPGTNSAMASNILLFLSALRGGNMKGWMGSEATATLERGGHHDLLNRLGSDAAQLGRASETPGPGDWRALPIPLFDGADLQQIWAFVREHRRAGDLADKKALRFVVELELTALGPMQLDGLIQDKQFDLIVRNSGKLPVAVRQGLAGLFEGSVEATGFSGNIIFQSDTTWPVSPFREAQQEAAGHGEILA